MKIKTISRSEEASTRSSKLDVLQVHKNPDPALHPFERAREVARALRAAKLERVFAKPFVGAMSDHADGVYACATSPTSLVAFVTGAADGEAIVWDLAAQRKLWAVPAHDGFVRGLAVSHDGRFFFSVGDDRTLKQWPLAAAGELAAGAAGEGVGVGRRGARAGATSGGGGGGGGGGGSASASSGGGGGVSPLAVWSTSSSFLSVDAHWSEPLVATSSAAVEVWDVGRGGGRGEAAHRFEWGADSVTSVRWNPAERSLLASTGEDHSLTLYDTRAEAPLRKCLLASTANCVAWNPREPINVAVGCEDGNAYTFDMRKLGAALLVHRDHTGAVMDLSFAPTGREFATGSYDRTVRLWAADGARSREVYHTKRMQRVFGVRYTGDARFVLSVSDDANVRVWKARAAESLRRALPRERAAADYAGALKARYAAVPEVRRVLKSRHVPKAVARARADEADAAARARAKAANVRAHARPGSKDGVPAGVRAAAVVREIK